MNFLSLLIFEFGDFVEGSKAFDINKEVVEPSKKALVIVDFYASWCVSTDSYIALTNRDIIKAKDLKKNSNVLCFNKNKLTTTSILKSFESQKAGHCKFITTENGRNIKITNDHLFFTKKGWKSAENLRVNDCVAIHPSFEKFKEDISDTTLVDENLILKFLEKRMTHKDYITELKKKGLLPLKTNNKCITILSRLIGSLFSDGNLYIGKNNYREISFTVGTKQDAKEIENDLNILGFKTHIKEKISENNLFGRKFTTHCYGVKCCSTSLWLLFKSLGVPIGNKTNTDYILPSWLMKASKNIQKEFLSGYIGGDGPKPTILLEQRKENKGPCDHLLLNDIEFHKNPKSLKNGLKYAKQLSKLFSNFGIKIRNIFSEDEKYVRKDGITPKIIHLQFTTNYENGFNLCNKIGYSYCKQKQENAIKIGEFLKKRIYERHCWTKKHNKAMQLYTKNHSIKKISEKLNLSYDTVFGWIKGNNKPTTFKHYEKYKDWLKKEYINGGLFWNKISKIKNIYLKSVQIISTKEPHNFFANDFLVHNCGPCKVLGPLLEKLCNEYKVKLVKIDVEQNEALAEEFGVMSIPTVIFFKDGIAKDFFVGSYPEKQIKDLIEKYK